MKLMLIKWPIMKKKINKKSLIFIIMKTIEQRCDLLVMVLINKATLLGYLKWQWKTLKICKYKYKVVPKEIYWNIRKFYIFLICRRHIVLICISLYTLSYPLHIQLSYDLAMQRQENENGKLFTISYLDSDIHTKKKSFWLSILK